MSAETKFPHDPRPTSEVIQDWIDNGDPCTDCECPCMSLDECCSRCCTCPDCAVLRLGSISCHSEGAIRYNVSTPSCTGYCVQAVVGLDGIFMPAGYYTRKPIGERFWNRVNKEGPLWNGTPCWIWTGALMTKGYGTLENGQRREGAHRIAYKLRYGSIPEGLTIDHLCRNKPCVNPGHLEAVTNRTNVLRGVGPSAQNARKTHCLRGHEYTEANTYRSNGKRSCRTCPKM